MKTNSIIGTGGRIWKCKWYNTRAGLSLSKSLFIFHKTQDNSDCSLQFHLVWKQHNNTLRNFEHRFFKTVVLSLFAVSICFSSYICICYLSFFIASKCLFPLLNLFCTFEFFVTLVNKNIFQLLQLTFKLWDPIFLCLKPYWQL